MLSVPFESSSPRSGERVGTNVDANELLDRLPLSSEGDSDRHDSYLRARELAIESREADLAEWEQSLAAMESDLRNREAILEWRIDDEARRQGRDGAESSPIPSRVVSSGVVSSVRRDIDLAAQLDRKVELMNDLLKELKTSQTENLAQRRAIDEMTRAADRRDAELDRLEDSLTDVSSEVASARVTVSAQQDELETQRDQVRNELNQLQADREAFDSDRQQMQDLLAALREERAALQRERDRYLLECGPAPVTPASSDSEARGATAEETAASAEARAETLTESISTELSQDSDHFNRLFAAPRETPPSPAPAVPTAPVAAEYELHDCDESSIAEYMDRLLNRARRGRSDVDAPTPTPSRAAHPRPAAPRTTVPASAPQTPSTPSVQATGESSVVVAAVELPPQRVRPRQNTQEIREGIHQLRMIANLSAHEALSKYFWKRHRSAFTLKLMLVILSFALAGALYVNHGVSTSSFTALAWGAAAIGLITACNLVHTLTELNRLNTRFHQEAFGRPAD
jgi:hypothetical protein